MTIQAAISNDEDMPPSRPDLSSSRAVCIRPVYKVCI
jgi:hypothetical protein